MKLVSMFVIVAIVSLASGVFAEFPPTSNLSDLSAIQAVKDAVPHGKPLQGERSDGEDIASAMIIYKLPFRDEGNTCYYLNDYDESCPFDVSDSPDVVYSFVSEGNLVIDISLVHSSYDTKLYVRDEAGITIACNDDFCSGPVYEHGYLSFIDNVPLAEGQTYYFVVDGYGGDCGEYVLEVDKRIIPPPPPCDPECPEGAIPENEPIPESCGVPDIWNGGCNSDPAVFQPLAPECDGSLVVCGATWFDGTTRDTDWYEIVLTETTELTFCVVAQFGPQIIILEPIEGCDQFDESRITTGPACEPVCLSYVLEPGTYWLWVGVDPSQHTYVTCGWEYVMTVDGYYPLGGPSATEESTWGTVKSTYR
jgi:hypothetical protein